MFGVKRLFITSVLTVIFVNVVGAEEFKPSRIVHTQAEESDITQTITELKYDDSGRLVKFIEYEAGDEADPQFNIDLVWNTNEVFASGLVDYDEANVIIYFNSCGLATEIVNGSERITFSYANNNLESMAYDEDMVYFSYADNELQKIGYGYGESIELSYGADKRECTVPLPVVWNNILYYYRFAVYAGLLGQPDKSYPTEYNRYGDGWVNIDYTFNKDGNPTKIYSARGMTHSSFDSEEFVYEYTQTNSVACITMAQKGIVVDGASLRITGMDSTELVSLFDITGRLLIMTRSGVIDLPAEGIYIVKVGEQVYKLKI